MKVCVVAALVVVSVLCLTTVHAEDGSEFDVTQFADGVWVAHARWLTTDGRGVARLDFSLNTTDTPGLLEGAYELSDGKRGLIALDVTGETTATLSLTMGSPRLEPVAELAFEAFGLSYASYGQWGKGKDTFHLTATSRVSLLMTIVSESGGQVVVNAHRKADGAAKAQTFWERYGVMIAAIGVMIALQIWKAKRTFNAMEGPAAVMRDEVEAASRRATTGVKQE